MDLMHRDIVYFTSQKLQGDWSAADFGKHLTPDNLDALLQKYDRLEPLVRVRLLLSVLTLDKQKLSAIQPQLKALLASAKDDKEEWVSITARALNNFEKPLNLQAAISGSAVVNRSVKELESRLSDAEPLGFQPFEDLYLSNSLVENGTQDHAAESHHFRIRNNGANSLEDLYKRASESAAAAVNSIKTHPVQANPMRSNLASNTVPPARHTEGNAGFRSRPAVSANPLSRQRPTTSHSGMRRAGETEMFRSSRPTDLGARPAATSITGHIDRRNLHKPGGVKLLDVNEVKRLNRNHVASPQHSAPTINGNARATKPAEESEEEGEIEAGEFTEDAQSGPSLKRARQAEVLS